jgi:HlyD family secretion protein
VKRIAVIAVFALIAVAGVVAVISALFQPVEVEVQHVSTGDAIETVYATGHVEARERRIIRAQRAGVIDEVYSAPGGNRPLQEGDNVKAGQPVLRLRDSALQARKDAARAELHRVAEQLKTGSPYRQAYESRIAEARNVAEDDRSREQRLKAQLETGGISRDAYDQARTRAEVAEAQVAQLTQQYAQALEDLEAARLRARAELDTLAATEQDNVITAPIAGTILTLPLKTGEFAPAGAEILKVGDLSTMIIEAQVNEDDIGRVRSGAAVHIRLAGFEDTLVRGSVYEILPDADRGTKGYTVRVSFSNAEPLPEPRPGARVRLEDEVVPLSGMTAELGVIANRRSDAVVFPRPALTAGGTVFVVQDGRAREVKVSLGLMNFQYCEALTGLSAGDRVAVSNLNQLRDGALVRVKE